MAAVSSGRFAGSAAARYVTPSERVDGQAHPFDGLPTRARKVLLREGFGSVAEVAERSVYAGPPNGYPDYPDLLEYRGMGPTSIAEVREMLREHGYELPWFAESERLERVQRERRETVEEYEARTGDFHG